MKAWAAVRSPVPPPGPPPAPALAAAAAVVGVGPEHRARERLVLIGLLLVATGAAGVYWPAGFIVPGLYLLAVTWPPSRLRHQVQLRPRGPERGRA